MRESNWCAVLFIQKAYLLLGCGCVRGGGFNIFQNTAVKRQEVKADADKKMRLLQELRQAQCVVRLLR